MQNLQIKMKSVIIVVSVIVVFILFAFFIIINRMETLKQERYLEVSKSAVNELKTLIDEKKESILNISLSMAENSTLQQALLDNNSSHLTLTAFSSRLRDNTSLKNVWFQVLTPDGSSFYRSWTEKSGDNLTEVRKDIAKMIQNPELTTSISTGKFDLTFKAMVPVYSDGKFIGIFETLAKFNSVALKMDKKGFDTVILVDKKYKKQLTNPFSKNFISDYYVANIGAKRELTKYLKFKTAEYMIKINKPYFLDEKNNHFISFYHLNDIEYSPMAYFMIFKDLDKINMKGIYQIRANLIGFFTIVLILFFALAYYFYIKRHKNMIEQLNIELEEKVELKTKTLNHLAHHDSLTNLPNRLLFLDRLSQSIKHAKRVEESVSILFLDLDRFKEINDSYGHDTGDELLKVVALRLVNCVREEDTIARLGGDEFTIVIKNTNVNDIVKFTEKVINVMKEPINLNNNQLYITVSVGISRYPDDGLTSDILLRNADTAMYKAKDLGKNTYQSYNPQMTKQSLARLTLDHNIRHAIERHEFQPFYQAQIDAVTNKITGMEALIRWFHPELGMISPDAFIPLAEEVGLIIEIDKWMMSNTIETLVQWQKEGLVIGKLSLNLSIKHLESKDFIQNLQQMLKETNFNPLNLEFEITESQIMKDPESSIEILYRVKELGITIAIDDFGTGYSSLSYLKRLPIDKLKIDRSFIQDVPNDEEDVAIVRSIIALAKSLKLDLIAEGVETKEQEEFLVSEGCTCFQGYLYSKPICADEFKKLLS
ncbi:MAG: EAL domain-containing protein [Sulfurimonas sp.]|jgi:diguanylate cyclase (GGDEF)-like protein|nr:EAL domain-containing protein [Sulfurimonas sp.]